MKPRVFIRFHLLPTITNTLVKTLCDSVLSMATISKHMLEVLPLGCLTATSMYLRYWLEGLHDCEFRPNFKHLGSALLTGHSSAYTLKEQIKKKESAICQSVKLGNLDYHD